MAATTMIDPSPARSTSSSSSHAEGISASAYLFTDVHAIDHQAVATAVVRLDEDGNGPGVPSAFDEA